MPTEREGCGCWFCSSRRVRRALGLPVEKPVIIQPEPAWTPYDIPPTEQPTQEIARESLADVAAYWRAKWGAQGLVTS